MRKKGSIDLKKILSVIAAFAALTMTLSGCSMLSGDNQQDQYATNQLKNYDFSQLEFIQLEDPYEGQPIATIKTSVGTMKVMLFPEQCPKTVQNFINRAKDGYYNNNNIFLVYPDAYFMAGSSAEDGSTGATDDGNPIENECSVKLWPFKGAMLAYNDTIGYGDSRYFIANTVEMTDEELEQIRSAVDDEGNRLCPDELIQAFVDNGALPGLSGSYTVFGQTIEGIEVLEKIIKVEIDEKTMMPLEKIIVESVEISEYHA